VKKINTLVLFGLLMFALLPSVACSAARLPDAPQKTPALPDRKPPDIVIGFVGGYVSHDNLHHAEVQIAGRLREAYPQGVYIEAFENRRYKDADKTILNLLDVNHDGNVTQAEKNQARIMLYGHSWGAAAAIMLARELQKQQIPVTLTIQVDSVDKFGWVDDVIPSNVKQAANFYQTHGSLSGLREIKAEDPSKTKILGNFLFDYSKDPIVCKGYPWWDRYFARAHTEIECDPKVWGQVEDLIRKELPPVPGAENAEGQKKTGEKKSEIPKKPDQKPEQKNDQQVPPNQQ
jgi:hypothetical protein